VKKQTFPGTLDALEPIRKYVEASALSAGLDRKVVYKLCLAVDEIATNVVLHGYEEAGLSGDLKIESSMEDDRFVVLLEDSGRPYDPNVHTVFQAEFDQPLESRKIGGLGIFLARDGVDELQYSATGNANVHRFIVRLSQT